MRIPRQFASRVSSPARSAPTTYNTAPLVPPQLLSVLKRPPPAHPAPLPGMQAAGVSSTAPGRVRVPPVSPTRGRVLLLGSGYVSAPIVEYLSKTTSYELTIGMRPLAAVAVLQVTQPLRPAPQALTESMTESA